MTNRPSVWLAACALSLTLVAGGCKSKPTGVAVRNQDGSITNPDGTVTYPAKSQQAQQAEQAQGAAAPQANGATVNSDGSVTYPQNSKPVTAVPTSTPAPEARHSEPERRAEAAPVERKAPVERREDRSIPNGTRIVVSTNETLKASTSEVGDSFSGTLAQPVRNSAGHVLYARGTRVAGSVVASKGRGRFKGSGALGIELSSVGGDRVQTSEYEKEEKGRGKRTGALIGGGGGLGALIGGLAGGGKGALIGGLAGAGAGTAGAAYTGSHDVVIPAESVITFTSR